MRKRLFLLSLLIVFSFAVFRISTTVLAEQSGSSPESGGTSRLKTISDALITLGHGSTAAGVWGDWGAMWNRIYSAAAWAPNGNLVAADVLSGKTFYNVNRTQKTGTLSYTGTATANDVAIGKTFYSNDGTLKTGARLSVGDTFGGGIVYYILAAGDIGYNANLQHGLIAAAADAASTSYSWDPNLPSLTGAHGTAIGTGYQNTLDIIAQDSTSTIIARQVRNMTLNGYTDWYLPSKDELTQAYKVKSIIGLTASSYASSTEYARCLVWYMDSGGSWGPWDAWRQLTYRAIRSF